MTTQPMLIRDGKAHAITVAQLELGRRGQPMGPIAGLCVPHPPAAATSAPAPAAARQSSASDGRAISRTSMLKAIGAKYGAEARKTAEASANPRRADVDPKLNVVGTPRPRMSRADARAMSRQNMAREIERIGGGVS